MKRVINRSLVVLLVLCIVTASQADWEAVGGIGIDAQSSPPPTPPGTYDWPYDIPYGIYTFPDDNGEEYARLVADNSLPEDSQYITQTIIGEIPSGFNGQQFLAYALPVDGATGVWVDLIYDGGVETDQYISSSASFWTTNWWQVNPTAAASSLTIKIGITKNPAVTTGYRSILIDRALLWCWANPPLQWENYDFEPAGDPKANRVFADPCESPLPLLLEEGETTTEVTFSFNEQDNAFWPGDSVVITVAPDAQLEVNGAGAGVAVVLTFTTDDANVPQTVTVNAINDIVVEGDHSGTVTSTSISADPNYDALVIRSLTYDIQDNDAINVGINPTSLNVDEEGPTTDTYTVVLEGAPSGNAVVTADPEDRIQVNSAGEGIAVELTFTTNNWNIAQTVTVAAIDNGLSEGLEVKAIAHSAAGGGYNSAVIDSVNVTIADNDPRSCYDPCDVPEPTDLIDLRDLANLSTDWLQPYTGQFARRPLEFRALLVNPNPGYKRWDPPHTDTTEWTNRLNMWRDEGFNALLHWIVCEIFFHGTHKLIQIEDYPEARHLTSTQVQNNINNFSWVLSQAKQRNLDNYLYTHHILYTPNFASAHGLSSNGERSELTRAYTESVYAEFCRTYPDLDGFYGSMGEPVPGRRSEWFAEAVVPGLTCTGGRENTAPRPRFIVNQWQTPLEDYLEDIAPADVYPDTWLSLHAYNGEQITDAEPWPFVTTWAKQTGLPTVVMLYPANIFNFPFNSPEFAYEIANEIKLIPNIKGFVYMEWSGRSLSPLFRKALAYYASTNEEYSDEPWLDILEAEYGNRTAAEHFLNAFKLSGRIMPDKDALFFCPHDNLKRELNIPYSYWQLNQNRPWNWQTSRVRGKTLVPVWHYASMIAENASRFEGKDGTEANHQYPVFRTDGGSAYDIIPPDHMASIRQRGADAYDAATLGLAAATSNQTKAEHMQRYMKGYKLLSQYFETKVAATTEAFIAAKNNSATRKTNAQTLANQAYNEWVAFYNFCMTENPKLNDLAQYYNGDDLREIGLGQETMADLLNEELSDKNNIGTIFGWSGY